MKKLTTFVIGIALAVLPVGAAVTSAQAETGAESRVASGNALHAGDQLRAGEQIESQPGGVLLQMQADGNLVVKFPTGFLWNSTTAAGKPTSEPGSYAAMQNDGNLVVYRASGGVMWASGTNGHPDASAVMQSDGNLVIVSAQGGLLWNSFDSAGLTAPSPSSRLASSQILAAGEQFTSGDGRYRVTMQSDGNLVVYAGRRVVWASKTFAGGSSAHMQSDGNLVVYAAGGKPVWSTNTQGHPGATLLMQTDGNLVIEAQQGGALWNSAATFLPQPVSTTGSTLASEGVLGSGAALHAPAGRVQAVMQLDGNFVVYRDGRAIWNTRTGVAGSTLHMQFDGNLVIETPRVAVPWNSGTFTSAGAHLSIQDDGNLVIYASTGAAVWSSLGGLV